MPRPDGRSRPDELRPVNLELGVSAHAEGSCLAEVGRTRVWITATVEDRVPPHRRGTGHGWVTAEYSMLPRATQDRGQREAAAGRIGGGDLDDNDRVLGAAPPSRVGRGAAGG